MNPVKDSAPEKAKPIKKKAAEAQVGDQYVEITRRLTARDFVTITRKYEIGSVEQIEGFVHLGIWFVSDEGESFSNSVSYKDYEPEHELEMI
jgi:hypothetical protein